MNIIDSDPAGLTEAAPDNPAAVPGAAQVQKTAAALRARVVKILSASGVKMAEPKNGSSHFTFGVERLDQALAGHAGAAGLPRAALHELHAEGKGDRASTAAIALLMAERCREGKPVLWISESSEARRHGRLYPPGLIELGIDPDVIIHVDAPDSIAALRAAADGVRNAAMGVVIVELAGRKPRGLDMTATRRLSLSAKQSGVMALSLRSGSDADDPLPTAAFSRWEVSAAPSSPLPVRLERSRDTSRANAPSLDYARHERPIYDPIASQAPGHSTFDITLLRHRSGLYGLSARLEWNREYRTFREQPKEAPPDTGAVPALAADRAVDQTIRAA